MRGALSILLTFFMGIWSLSFNAVGGPIYDEMGPASPFMLCAVFDVALCLFAITLGITGHLNTQADTKLAESAS